MNISTPPSPPPKFKQVQLTGVASPRFDSRSNVQLLVTKNNEASFTRGTFFRPIRTDLPLIKETRYYFYVPHQESPITIKIDQMEDSWSFMLTYNMGSPVPSIYWEDCVDPSFDEYAVLTEPAIITYLG